MYYRKKKVLIPLQILLIFALSLYNIFFIINQKLIKNYNLNNKNNIIRKINQYIIICKKSKIINKRNNIFLQNKITATIIIYNAEKTIVNSIRSIQNQNMEQIQILLVDDYSLDNSLKIIQKLQEDDNRINIIKNKNNKGSLFSRSIAALYAKGKYIMALDSDDTKLYTSRVLFLGNIFCKMKIKAFLESI